MRKYFLVKYLWVALLLGVGPCTNLHGLTIWNGNVTADVVDDDINITGNVDLGDGSVIADQNVCVSSVGADITITPTGGDWTITPFNDGGGNGPVALHLSAAAGRTITVDLSAQSLDFVGNAQAFLVSFAGAGNLVFNIGDGQHVGFINNVEDAPGAYFMVVMDVATHTPNAQSVIFARSSNAGDGDAAINVGQNSILGFLADDASLATQAAVIGFDATNNVANIGRLRLNIADGGSASVQAYATTNLAAACGTFSINDIDFTTLAGNRGSFQTLTQGGAAWSGFLVVNSNATLPSLRSNPWCEDDLEVGIQPGFVIGINGELDVLDGTYFDYVGAAVNVSPEPTIPEEILANVFPNNCINPQVNQVVKDRNPSALFTDGPVDNCDTTNRPQINLFGTSKIYFRSAVDSCGLTPNADFTVNYQEEGEPFNKQLTGPLGNGSIVFDVEGVLDIFGFGDGDKAINILSLYEDNTGGSVLIEGTETTFKLRPDPWLRDVNDVLLQYGKASFMINGRMNIFDGIALQHTDEIHEIFDKNVPQQSEPSYIGGESFVLCKDRRRPTIALYGPVDAPSSFLIQTSAALTGVDFLTPSRGTAAGENAEDNFANFVFYGNGYCIDQGTGRLLIMGTDIGALASDLGTIVNRDAHFDIIEEQDQGGAFEILATVLTLPNNNKVTEGAPADGADIASQYSVHSFFLGHASNISIGTPAQPGASSTEGIDVCTGEAFTLLSTPTLLIDGDFLAFETQGGIKNAPETSVETGQGGIFIDKQGLMTIADNRRMSIATMIGLGFNGAVNLPVSQVYFHERIGITRSNLDMTDPAQVIIIPLNASVSDFTLDWKYTIRDTCGQPSNYEPYAFPAVPDTCSLTPVTEANITNIPVVAGTVEQFQIKNSRLGDEAAFIVDGGLIREFVVQTGYDSGMAPAAVVTLQNNATLGLGRASRYVDTLDGSLVLGVNGVVLMPNEGNSQVILNDNAVINNAAPILAGPNFGEEAASFLEITSDVPREIRVKNTGVLDLSQFTESTQTLIISGKVTLVFEPGSRLVLGGGNLEFAEDAAIRFESYLPIVTGVNRASTDVYRVKWSGTGTITIRDNGFMELPSNSLLGIESGPTGCPEVTSLNLVLKDAGAVYIGSDTDYGGGIQVGNTAAIEGGLVSFGLTINGPEAVFNINSQGFLGLGVGIVNKPFGTVVGAPNNWTVAPLLQTAATTIDVIQGVFRHNNINDGASTKAGLMAIGAASVGHTFLVYPTAPDTSIVQGGGNIVQISGQTAPTVLTTNGVINGNLSAGILASGPTLEQPGNVQPAFPATATQIFNYLAADPYVSQVIKYAQAANTRLGILTIGYINPANTINRVVINGVRGPGGGYVNPQSSLDIGAVGLSLSSTGAPTAYSIRP